MTVVFNGTYLKRLDERQLQQVALDVLENDYAGHVVAEIQSTLETETAKLYVPYATPQRNLLLRVVSLQAQLYNRPPRRRAEDPQWTQDLQTYCPDLDAVLAEAQKLCYGAGDCAIMPYWSESEGLVRFDLLRPVDYDKVYSRSTLQEILLTQNGKKVAYLPKGKTRDEDGPEVQTKFTVRPVCPFALTYEYEKKPWSIRAVADIIRATVLIGVLEAYRNRGHYLRSQRIPYQSGDDFDQNLATTDRLPTDQTTIFRGKLEAVSLADEDDKFVQSIRADLADIAASRGISEMTLQRSISDPNQLNAATKELAAVWNQSAEIFRRQEKILLSIVTELFNINLNRKYDPQQKVRIDYLEPAEQLQSPLDALKTLEMGVKQGVDNVEDFVALRFPDLTSDEEINDYLQACIDSRAKMVEKMRALNMPAETGNPGQDPEVNGANGPLLVPREVLDREEIEPIDEEGNNNDDR